MVQRAIIHLNLRAKNMASDCKINAALGSPFSITAHPFTVFFLVMGEQVRLLNRYCVKGGQ